jgi:hypothetical protein
MTGPGDEQVSDYRTMIARGELPMGAGPKDGTEIVAWTAEGNAWIVSWSQTGWRVKKPPGRDPILYIDPVRWMPLPP